MGKQSGPHGSWGSSSPLRRRYTANSLPFRSYTKKPVHPHHPCRRRRCRGKKKGAPQTQKPPNHCRFVRLNFSLTSSLSFSLLSFHSQLRKKRGRACRLNTAI